MKMTRILIPIIILNLATLELTKAKLNGLLDWSWLLILTPFIIFGVILIISLLFLTLISKKL